MAWSFHTRVCCVLFFSALAVASQCGGSHISPSSETQESSENGRGAKRSLDGGEPCFRGTTNCCERAANESSPEKTDNVQLDASAHHYVTDLPPQVAEGVRQIYDEAVSLDECDEIVDGECYVWTHEDVMSAPPYVEDAEIARVMKDQGYFIIPQAVGQDEIETMRGLVDDYFSQPHAGFDHVGGRSVALAINLEKFEVLFEMLFENPEVIRHIRAALGGGPVSFLHHSEIQWNITTGNWHQDITQAPYRSPWLWNQEGIHYRTVHPDYSGIRLLLLLQDHLTNSNGLWAIAESHRLPVQGAYDLRTKKGDVIIFDMRLWHSGPIDNRGFTGTTRGNVQLSFGTLGNKWSEEQAALSVLLGVNQRDRHNPHLFDFDKRQSYFDYSLTDAASSLFEGLGVASAPSQVAPELERYVNYLRECGDPCRRTFE